MHDTIGDKCTAVPNVLFAASVVAMVMSIIFAIFSESLEKLKRMITMSAIKVVIIMQN